MSIHHNKNVDLKLLTIFNAVFEEGSVSEAAKRLELEQSHVSHSLARLRKFVGDPLFVRSGRSIAPTPKAIAIAPSIAALIRDLAELAQPDDLHIAASRRVFSISANDFERRVFATGLTRAILAQAPDAGIAISDTPGQFAEPLRKGECDCVVTPLPPPDLNEFHAQTLFEDRFVCFFDDRHLDARTVRENYADLKHAMVRFAGNPQSPVEAALGRSGIQRSVKLFAPSFGALAELTRDTDFIVTVPSRLQETVFSGFAQTQPPIDLPKLVFNLIWHGSTHRSAEHQWLRDQIVQSVSSDRARS